MKKGFPCLAVTVFPQGSASGATFRFLPPPTGFDLIFRPKNTYPSFIPTTRISRQTARRLMQEIAKRDALLAYSAPSPLLDAGLTAAQRADRASQRGGTQPRPVAQLRFQPIGPRALLQLELDQYAVRRLVSALGNLLSLRERSPRADLPALHLVLVEKK